MKKHVLLISLCLALTGCAVGPDYERPKLDVPVQFEQAPQGWKIAQVDTQLIPTKWWLLYQDPVLDGLMDELNKNNLNIQIALANYDRARANLGATQADFLPNVNASASNTRSGNSRVTAGANTAPISERKSVGLDAAWELDLWGRIRRNVEASSAQLNASKADLNAMKLSMQAQFVQAYFMLRMSDELLRENQQVIEAYQKSLEIAQYKYEVGLVTVADVSAVKTQWLNAQASQLNYQQSRLEYKNTLAILLGRAPANFQLEPGAFNATMPKLPPVLASELLERRPDIIAAESNLAAASAQIGVAKAAFYPSFSLSANIGSNAAKMADLFTSPTEVWSLATSIGQIVFDGGKRSAQVDAAQASYQAALGQYRLAVLTSLQEAENALANTASLENELVTRDQAVSSAKLAEEVSRAGYEVGTIDLSGLLQNQIAHTQARLNLIQLNAQRYTEMATLIKALGGGWEQKPVTRLRLANAS